MKFARLVVAGLLASAPVAPALAQDIDTTAPFTLDITYFGTRISQTYGQTFTVGTESYLNSFSLYLAGGKDGPFDYKAYLYAWDGIKATGPALYVSDIQHYTATDPTLPEEERYDTGDLLLTSGQKYVAFLSTTELPGQPSGLAGMPASGTFPHSSYAGGEFVFYNNPDFALLTTHEWSVTDGGFGDVWFKADFSADATPTGVPEPAAWGMMLGGFGLVGATVRRRRRVYAIG